MEAIVLQFSEALRFLEEEFFQFCQNNVNLKRTKDGDIIIMPPTGGETVNHNIQMVVEIELWNRSVGFDKVFDSSTGFRLPDGSVKSPGGGVVGPLDGTDGRRTKEVPALVPRFRSRYSVLVR